MDVVFVLARMVAAWLTGLIGSGQEGFFAMAAGMKSWFHGEDDTDGRLVAFLRKNFIVILVAVNLVVAVAIGMIVSAIEHRVQPILTHIPTPVVSPTPTTDSSSCSPAVEATPTS